MEGIGISRTTLGRRKRVGRLGFVESERAVRLGSIIALGKAALGSTRGRGWLVIQAEHGVVRCDPDYAAPNRCWRTPSRSSRWPSSLRRFQLVDVYRVGYRIYAKNPLSGEGSFLYGGRWSSSGTRMAHTSTTLTLAMAEFLEHVRVEDPTWTLRRRSYTCAPRCRRHRYG